MKTDLAQFRARNLESSSENKNDERSVRRPLAPERHAGTIHEPNEIFEKINLKKIGIFPVPMNQSTG